MDKSPEAFRTISEVAEALETPAHVLRFWETRFPQIRPVKRAGGRRYYRPSDVALLAGIKRLLHEDGMTIRGVQKILREHGVRHVSGLIEEPSAEEQALDAAMLGRLDEEPDGTPQEAADATAAALEAALDEAAEEPTEAEIIAFPTENIVPADPRQTFFPGFEPEPESPVVETSESPTDSAADSFPLADTDAEPVPVPEPAPDSGAQDADPLPPPAPAPATTPVTPPAPARADSPGPTLAARLRALPPGRLAGQEAALAELAARIGALRNRLARTHPGE